MNTENNIGANDSTLGFEVVASTWNTDRVQIRDERAGKKEPPEGVNELILPATAINLPPLPPDLQRLLLNAHKTRLTDKATKLRRADKKRDEDRTM